jgi:Rrf2 family transcriptional regulator, nitric oxide-sensitive transcriptional repressor
VNLKVQTDYALRVLLFLAHKGEQASVEEIASAYQISKDHLFKVVQQLVRLGYVSSRSGRKGGVTLKKKPDTIRIDEVVSQFEGRNGVLACIDEPGVCVLEPGCVLRNMLIRAEQAFYNTLGQLSLADIIRPNDVKQAGGVYNLSIHRSAPPASEPT